MLKFLSLIFISIGMCLSLHASEEKKAASKQEVTLEETAVTSHSITIQGKDIHYEATVGTTNLKDEKGQAKASLFYTAYLQKDVENIGQRPIMFCFNGGPGAASVWLHMGCFGPKRTVMEEFHSTAPPYHSVVNEYCLLDLTDLVFIDPISTGYSRPISGEDPKQFNGLEEDVKWVGEFIRYFLTHYNRWESPKFIAGESYGTTRAAVLADCLSDDMFININGIVLLSSVLDFQVQDNYRNENDLAFITALPALTAVAWYHKKLAPELSVNLSETLQAVEEFALTDYALALLRGDWLAKDKKENIASQLSFFTGLPLELIIQNNLRINIMTFFKELLKKENRVVGRYDGRYTGINTTHGRDSIEFLPGEEGLYGPITATFNAYVRGDLLWKKDDEYKALTNLFPWNYGNGANNKFLNVTSQLRSVISRNPACFVFLGCGYYDLATPYFGQKYTFHHLNLDPSIKNHVSIYYYEAGHMMYTHMPSLRKLRQDLEVYFQQALSKP